MMDIHEHWENVYRTQGVTEVSWYSAHLGESLRLIREVAPVEATIIDVGGGASTLVDDLLAAGYRRVTVLDIAETALALARTRIGAANQDVQWIAADVTTVELPEAAFDVWHDRAVFHFLTQERDRQAYVRTLRRSLAAGGHVIIGTFSLAGPARCSGLDVMRYDAAGLQRELGAEFVLSGSVETTHMTPAGRKQSFLICRFHKLGSAAA